MHGSIIFDHIGTRFLGGGATYTRERLIRENDLYASIYGNIQLIAISLFEGQREKYEG